MDSTAAQFLAVYTALHDFVASKPPEPYLQAAGAAMNLLASLAASVMINASRQPRPEAPGAVQD